MSIVDKTVPPAAAILLSFIKQAEVRQPTSLQAYEIYNSFVQAKLPKKLTQHTLAEVLAINFRSIGAKSTAAGAYQIIKATLEGLITELKLNRNTKFSAALQDRLGYHLLRRRGYDAWITGRIDDTEFAKRLAQEWASFPVLKPTKGASRQVERGQSYYAGDGLNKSTITPAQVEATLKTARAAGGFADAKPGASNGIVAAVGAAAAGGGAVVATVAPPVVEQPQESLQATLDTATQLLPTVATFAQIAPWLGGLAVAGLVAVILIKSRR